MQSRGLSFGPGPLKCNFTWPNGLRSFPRSKKAAGGRKLWPDGPRSLPRSKKAAGGQKSPPEVKNRRPTVRGRSRGRKRPPEATGWSFCSSLYFFSLYSFIVLPGPCLLLSLSVSLSWVSCFVVGKEVAGLPPYRGEKRNNSMIKAFYFLLLFYLKNSKKH